MAKKTLILLLLLVSCSESQTVVDEPPQSLNSEEVLNLIFDSYKNFTNNPEKAVDTIWGFAHENNKEITGPKERFSQMLVSEPYDSIIDLREYSYEVTYEDETNVHYEVKVLAKNNNYFIITWVFEKTDCPELKKQCWLTIAVTAPSYFDSGI
ncbi:MAG: hypothetical protein CL496_02530 [Actinobacteria bacterium]|nr:hypothetical protein [Actinomycetota bacterium]